MTNTDVAYPHYCRSCPCDRHDLYLPSIPASLQTLGRCECVAACALAPLGLRIISPLTFYLSFLGAIWTYDKNLAPIFPSHLSTVAPQIFSDPRPPSQRTYTVNLITFGSQVIWQYKMDLFPVAVLGSRNYFVWQNWGGPSTSFGVFANP